MFILFLFCFYMFHWCVLAITCLPVPLFQHIGKCFLFCSLWHPCKVDLWCLLSVWPVSLLDNQFVWPMLDIESEKKNKTNKQNKNHTPWKCKPIPNCNFMNHVIFQLIQTVYFKDIGLCLVLPLVQMWDQKLSLSYNSTHL